MLLPCASTWELWQAAMQREMKGPRKDDGSFAPAARRLTASTVSRLIGIDPKASKYFAACCKKHVPSTVQHCCNVIRSPTLSLGLQSGAF